MAKTDWRQYRKKVLESKGFLPFESQYYSQFLMSQSGMRKIICNRQREIIRIKDAGIPSSKIPQYIQSSYTAKGFIEDNKPSAEMYNSALYRQLELPYRQRKSLFISPERWGIYQQARKIKFAPKESLAFAENIPPELINERMKMYKALRLAHYSPTEATIIVTATYVDKDKEKQLQPLDLNSEVWQKAIVERTTWFNKQVKLGVTHGMKPKQAALAAAKEIENWYKKDSDRTIWDEIEDISPHGKPKPEIDFYIALKNRRTKQIKKKMPWLAPSK